MKKLILAIVFLTTLNLFAQENASKIREIGLNFKSLNSYGLRYKAGTTKTLFRLTYAGLNGFRNSINIDSIDFYKNNSNSINLNFGIERRVSISQKLDFYYGLQVGNSFYKWKYSNYNTLNPDKKDFNTWSITHSLGLILGFNYDLGNSFFLSAEIIPNAFYTYVNKKESSTDYLGTTKSNNLRTQSIDQSLGKNTLNFTLAYRFDKKK